MSPIYRWNGQFFGYLSMNGYLFDTHGHYVAWISDGRYAWHMEDSSYIGERVGAEYILRGAEPSAAAPPIPVEPTSLGFLPSRPCDLPARSVREGYVDGLDGL
jgi:hypothetical protein